MGALFLLLAGISACSRESDPAVAVFEETETLFSVGSIAFTVFEFQEAYVQHLIRTGRNDTRTERTRFLNQWIDNIILALEAQKQGLSNHPEYQAAVKYQEMKSVADVQFVLSMDTLFEPASEDELRLAFAKSKRKVYVRQLYARTREELLPWYQRLKKGEDFITLANQFYRTESFDSLAGYMGPINYYSADDRFAETAFSLNQHEFSEPIRSSVGWHIVWVEYIIFEAMLTESEYQTKLQGTTSRYNRRRYNLSARDYIMQQMQSLNVDVDADALNQLHQAIQSLSDGDIILGTNFNPDDPESWTESNLDVLDKLVDQDAVLAQFDLRGERISFTMGHYMDWLPVLPFKESLVRPGASVGRALRNHYFYLEGLSDQIQNTKDVRKKVRNRGFDVLSQLYQRSIIQSAISDTAAIDVPKWFVDRMVKNQSYELLIDYWFVPAENREQAIALKENLDTDAVSKLPSNAKIHRDELVNSNHPMYTLLRDAILKTSMVAFTSENGWGVLYVSSREATPISETSTDGVLGAQFKAYTSLNDSIEAFRSRYEIIIDTLLFEDIYELKPSQ